MQDRFKFRVWNKLAKVMTYNVCLGNFELKAGETLSNKIDWIGIDYNEPETFICFKDTATEYLELMQCTGLKDKNGKLIFEGDLLKANRTYFTSIGEIKFGLDRNEHLGFFIDWHDKSECIRQDLQYWLPWVEVIGNIYENPELLELEE